jgi:CDP-2,3-bis-(O-geranylgeranyl)-sn-glycerol synthase
MNELVWFLLFFTPAYVANMLPPFFRKLPGGWPIDGGKTWRGHRLLGENKTWRGLCVGTLGGGLVGYALQAAGLPFVWWWGLWLGFAALVGDALKSLVKRQIGIKPGGRWVPFDQIDFMIAATLVSFAFIAWSWSTVLFGFLILFGATVLVQIIGGATGIKKDKL